jgi:hypothetical protein
VTSEATRLQANLLLEIKAAGLPEPIREYPFAKEIGRRWRFDLAWDQGVAFEFEGGSWTGGRHTTPQGFQEDCLKYSWAAILGWIVLRCTYGQVKDGTAIRLIQEALKNG